MSPNIVSTSSSSGPQIVVSGPEKWLRGGGLLDIEAASAASENSRGCAAAAGDRFSRPRLTERFAQLEARLKSFSEWPAAMQQQPNDMAELCFLSGGARTSRTSARL
jgi:hypothetical protein